MVLSPHNGINYESFAFEFIGVLYGMPVRMLPLLLTFRDTYGKFGVIYCKIEACSQISKHFHDTFFLS